MTSAQLILVSVSSALIAVITMLVVAVALRARTREGSSTGTKGDAPTGNLTRAQRAATRAQQRAKRATERAEKKVKKAEIAAAKKPKPEKGKDVAASTDKAGKGEKPAGNGASKPISEADAKGGPTTEAGKQAAAATGPSAEPKESSPPGTEARKKS